MSKKIRDKEYLLSLIQGKMEQIEQLVNVKAREKISGNIEDLKELCAMLDTYRIDIEDLTDQLEIL
jgi:predicted nucleotidyltransferase